MRVFVAFLNKPQEGTIGQIQIVGNYETTGWSFFHISVAREGQEAKNCWNGYCA